MTERALAIFDAAARVRLARLLGLLGSDHDGEIANAGRMAHRLVQAHGLTWTDIVSGVTTTARKPRKPRKPRARRASPPAPAPSETWPDIAAQILRSGLASPWEISFCESLLMKWRGRNLSEKQRATLAEAWRKCCAHSREAA